MPFSGCIDSFNKFGNTLSLSGQDRGTVTDVAACQAICLADATCAGFDYNRATKKCFTHTTTTLAMVGQASPANIDQYRRVYCASTTVTQTAIVGGTATTRAATTGKLTLHKYPDSKVNGDQHGAHVGPTRPRLAPCWHHGPCSLGSHCKARVAMIVKGPAHAKTMALYCGMSWIIWTRGHYAHFVVNGSQPPVP